MKEHEFKLPLNYEGEFGTEILMDIFDSQEPNVSVDAIRYEPSPAKTESHRWVMFQETNPGNFQKMGELICPYEKGDWMIGLKKL